MQNHRGGNDSEKRHHGSNGFHRHDEREQRNGNAAETRAAADRVGNEYDDREEKPLRDRELNHRSLPAAPAHLWALRWSGVPPSSAAVGRLGRLRRGNAPASGVVLPSLAGAGSYGLLKSKSDAAGGGCAYGFVVLRCSRSAGRPPRADRASRSPCAAL